MSMDPEIKRKWVEALRSGEYKQGRGKLRDAYDQYCCLGILCDVLGEEWRYSPLDHYELSEGDFAFLSKSLLRQIGFDGYINNPLWTLATMNDHGSTFAEIADHIEEHL